MADLDNLTIRLKTRLYDKPRPVSPRDPLNHTGHSTQTETETSALTNSQQFLPVPPGGTTTSTDGDLRTLEGTKASAMSTTCASELAGLHTGSSTLLSGLVKDTVGHILHDDMFYGGAADLTDPILAGAPHEDKETPFGSYRPMVHEDSDKEEQDEGDWHDALGGTGHTGEAGSFEYNPEEDEHNHPDDDGDGEVIVPRALNDISNVNFNNMASYVQDYNSKLSEEDSWFTSHSPRRGSHLQYQQDTQEEVADTSVQYQPGNTSYPQEEGAMMSTGPLTATVSSLGGTATTLGTVGEADPYGRTLVGGHFNHTMKLHLNYDDSWATNNGSLLQDANKEYSTEEDIEQHNDEDVTREKLLEEPIGGGKSSTHHHKRDISDEDQNSEHSEDKPELTQEERSVILEEDPTSSASVSRTTLSETGSQNVNKVRKAAMFRREYDRHRTGHSSSDSDGGSGESDGDNSRPGSRRRRAKKTHASPTTKKTHFKMNATHSDSDNPDMVDSYNKEPSFQSSNYRDDKSGHSQGSAFDSETHTPRTEEQPSDMDGQERQESGIDRQESDRQGSDTQDQISDISNRTVTLDEGDKESTDGQSRHNLSKTSTSSVPNFFLPSSDMEQSMRALKTTGLVSTIILLYYHM